MHSSVLGRSDVDGEGSELFFFAGLFVWWLVGWVFGWFPLDLHVMLIMIQHLFIGKLIRD